jgi:hypothetical protein
MIMKVNVVGGVSTWHNIKFSLLVLFPVEHVLPREMWHPELVDIERY